MQKALDNHSPRSSLCAAAPATALKKSILLGAAAGPATHLPLLCADPATPPRPAASTAAAHAGGRLQWESPTDTFLVGLGPFPDHRMEGKSISPVPSSSFLRRMEKQPGADPALPAPATWNSAEISCVRYERRGGRVGAPQQLYSSSTSFTGRYS